MGDCKILVDPDSLKVLVDPDTLQVLSECAMCCSIEFEFNPRDAVPETGLQAWLMFASTPECERGVPGYIVITYRYNSFSGEWFFNVNGHEIGPVTDFLNNWHSVSVVFGKRETDSKIVTATMTFDGESLEFTAAGFPSPSIGGAGSGIRISVISFGQLSSDHYNHLSIRNIALHFNLPEYTWNLPGDSFDEIIGDHISVSEEGEITIDSDDFSYNYAVIEPPISLVPYCDISVLIDWQFFFSFDGTPFPGWPGWNCEPEPFVDPFACGCEAVYGGQLLNGIVYSPCYAFQGGACAWYLGSPTWDPPQVGAAKYRLRFIDPGYEVTIEWVERFVPIDDDGNPHPESPTDVPKTWTAGGGSPGTEIFSDEYEVAVPPQGCTGLEDWVLTPGA